MKHIINLFICTSVFILFDCVTIQAQYWGGQGDGAQKSSTIQITLNGNQINSLVLYQGGPSDGQDKKMIVATLSGDEIAELYKGGHNDGSSKNIFIGTLFGEDLVVLYQGGTGDGSHKTNYQGTLEGALLEVMYLGGINDGNSKDSYSGILTGEEIAQLYEGGFGDGLSKNSYSGILTGEELAQLYQGGISDGFEKEMFAGLLDGNELSALYSGGTGDGYSKNLIQYNFDFPGCTFVVNNDDDGFGSLRYAINCAVDGDTINFSPLLLNDSIQLTTGPLLVFQNDLYINADPSKNLIVDGSLEPNTLFTGINGFTDLKIKGLNIMSGTDPFGGAIQNGGLLTLENLNIVDTYNDSATVIATFNGGTVIIKGTVQLLNN